MCVNAYFKPGLNHKRAVETHAIVYSTEIWIMRNKVRSSHISITYCIFIIGHAFLVHICSLLQLMHIHSISQIDYDSEINVFWIGSPE